MSTTIKPLPPALQAHELAELLPDMQEGEFKHLVDSIQKIGQQNEIVLLDGKILDGRSRYAACIELGIPPRIRHYNPELDGPSPTDYVLAQNVNRRHLSTSQRAVVYTKALPHYQAEAEARQKATQFPAAEAFEKEPKPSTKAGRATEAAAAAAGVSPSTMDKAKRVTAEAPDLAAKVEAGEMTVAAAEKELKKRQDAAPATSERDDIAKEAFDALKESHGEDFAISVRDGVNLKAQAELEAFCSLSPTEQKSIRELIGRKWKVKAALEFINREANRDDKISTLFLRTLSAGGKKGTFVIDGWNVTVARAK